jgi:hypothetical protein
VPASSTAAALNVPTIPLLLPHRLAHLRDGLRKHPFVLRRTADAGSEFLPLPPHNPPHRPAHALDAGEQLHPPWPPPQPSWRIRSRISRSSVTAGTGMCVSEIMRTLPQRSHSIRRNHDWEALNGLSMTDAPVGSGSLQYDR